MGKGDRIADLEKGTQHLAHGLRRRRRKARRRDPVSQGPAMHQAHGEGVGSLVIHGQVVHGRDVGMSELRLDLRLGEKAPHIPGVVGQRGAKTLMATSRNRFLSRTQ